MSNTKICKISRDVLARFKLHNPTAGFLFSRYAGVTVLEMREFPGSKMKVVSVAIASNDEVKNRRSVGEYKAMEKFENGEYIKVPFDFDMMLALIRN